jgi:NAD-dependent deacetylase
LGMDFERVARMLEGADRVVALTGAGISVESGIPDFRSPGGLWARYDPSIYATFDSFLSQPSRFYEMAAELNPLLENAAPNAGHLALGELERMGKMDAVITQNIDNLHQRAGNSEVVELHGTFRTGACMQCAAAYDYEDIKQGAISGVVPTCRKCQGVIKPDVVFFGEPLNARVLQRAIELSTSCDLMIVIGCGLEVFPAASLPSYANRNDASLVFVNVGSTAYDNLADVILLGEAGRMMPEIVETYKKLVS